jgi:hypothetical protein
LQHHAYSLAGDDPKESSSSSVAGEDPMWREICATWLLFGFFALVLGGASLALPRAHLIDNFVASTTQAPHGMNQIKAARHC